MVLKIRLSRVPGPGAARRHAPVYNIVLAHARTARDSKPLEVLGTYDPIPKLPVGAEPGTRKQKDIKLDVSRAKYWLGVGAQPTDTTWRLLAMIGLLPPKYLPSGEQTENALRAVRFETHIPTKPSAPKPKKTGRIWLPHAEFVKMKRAEEAEAGGEVAPNTSPQDPNAA